MAVSARYLQIRLFIEGIEVPVISAVTSSQHMGPATAEIAIPYSEEAHNILPRSIIHLFFYDAVETGGSLEKVELGGPMDPQRWKLLFTGEFMSYRYVKSEGSRQISLSAVDFTNYWDLAKIYYGKASTGSRFYKVAMFQGAVESNRGKKNKQGTSNILKLLKARPVTYPTVQGLLGGVIALLESVTGVFDKRHPKQFRGASDFISQAELRLNISKTILAHPYDDSSVEFAKGKNFTRTLRAGSQYLRGLASYGQLIGMVLQEMYYTHTSVQAPPYFPGGTKIKTKMLVAIKPTAGAVAAATAGAASVAKYNSLVDTWTASMVGAIETTINRVDARTATGTLSVGDSDTLSNKVDAPGGPIKPDLDGLMMHKAACEAAPYPKDDQKYAEVIGEINSDPALDDSERSNLVTRVAHLKKANEINKLNTDVYDGTSSVIGDPAKATGVILAANVKNAVNANISADVAALAGKAGVSVSAEQPFKTASRKNLQDAKLELDKAVIAAKKRNLIKWKTVLTDVELPDRLVMTMLIPELWWAPPPKCNVLFPDQYSSVTYGRDYASEVTRLWLHGLRRSGADNWSRSYFAPNIDTINGQIDKGTSAKAANRGLSFLMPHEKFTGIIPAIQGLGNKDALETMNKINKKTEKEEGGKSITSWAQKDPALARASNYMFYKMRFQSRQVQIQGPFNPGLVAGLPGIVMDPRVIKRSDGNDEVTVAGKHICGNVQMVQHTFDQQGVSTVVVMTMCRMHDEELNIFGKVKRGKVSLKRSIIVGARKLPANGPVWAEVHGFKTVRRVETTPDGRRVVVDRQEPILGADGKTGDTGPHLPIMLANQSSAITVNEDLAGAVGGVGRISEAGRAADDLGAGMVTQRSYTDPIGGSGGQALGDVYARTGSSNFNAKTFNESNVKNKNLSMRPHKVPIDPDAQGDVLLNSAGLGDPIAETRTTAADSIAEEYGIADPSRVEATQVINIPAGKESVAWDGYEYANPFPWMNPRALGAVRVDVYSSPPRKNKKITKEFTFSFEMIARPPWAADIYLNQNIGKDFYSFMLGCGALTDLDYVLEHGVDVGSSGTFDPVGAEKMANDKKITDRLTKVGGKKTAAALNSMALMGKEKQEDPTLADVADVTVTSPDGTEMKVPAKLLGGVPIEVAAENLAEVYTKLAKEETSNANVMDFIEVYTRRKFASMTEIFGEGHNIDQAIMANASRMVPVRDSGITAMGTKFVKALPPYNEHVMFMETDLPKDGFHSYAFGPFTDMEFIQYRPLPTVLGGTVRKLAAYIDPRGERYDAVSDYVDNLMSIEGEKS